MCIMIYDSLIKTLGRFVKRPFAKEKKSFDVVCEIHSLEFSRTRCTISRLDK